MQYGAFCLRGGRFWHRVGTMQPHADNLMRRLMKQPPAVSLRDRYNDELAHGWKQDAAQEAAVTLLENLTEALHAGGKTPPKGIYMFGPVGRGKSRLLDMFVAQLGNIPVRRTHMHGFMTELHQRLNDIKSGDPIEQTAKEMSLEFAVLGFDEFYVTNIADAMLLGRLFEFLFKYQVVVVATSNWPMDELFQNGLNRDRFLPFLRTLQKNMVSVDLGNGEDYRQQFASAWPLYVITSTGLPAQPQLQVLFDHYTRGDRPAVPKEFKPVAFRGRCAWYTFEELCDQPVGRREYAKLVRQADTLVVENVPVLTPAEADAALRFVTLVDLCYEHRRRVIVSAAVYPNMLCTSGPVASAFKRTASRLAEMQAWHDAYAS